MGVKIIKYMRGLIFFFIALLAFINGYSQNVGIGTITPQYKLDVHSDGTSVAGKFFVVGNEPAAYLALTNQPPGNFDNITGLNIALLEIGVLGVSNHAGSPTDNIGIYGYSNGWAGKFEHSTSGNEVMIGGTTYPIQILDGATATSPGMVLTAMDANGNATWQNLPATGDDDWGIHSGSGLTANIYHAGKVGIGTNSSFEELGKLTVREENSATDGVQGVFLDIVNDEGNTANTLAGIRFSNYPSTATNPYLAGGIFWKSNGMTFGRGDMVFATGSSGAGNTVSAVNHARMTIMNSGDVMFNNSSDIGVGNGLTTTASYPIHVNTTNRGYGVYVYNASSGSNRAIYGYSTSATSSAYGVYGYATGASTVSKYGLRGYATTTGASVVYGVYANTTTSSTATSRYAGYFAGDVYCSGSYLPSYEKLKENIADAAPAMDRLLQLEIKEYSFNTKLQPHMNLPGGKQVGVLSSQLKTLYPGLVKKTIQPAPTPEEAEDMGINSTEDYEFEAVNYTGLVPHLVKGTQEQQAEIETLKAENEALKIRLEKIEARLNRQN